ncbi:MAG: VWA domain-containing protein [Candidatus Solibacter usitatus]|nr:VWA domain-containing protein [Candidatus Solibacter usitatus]
MRTLPLLLLLSAAVAQQEKLPTFKSSTNLVIVNVAVRDRAGKPIEGLKKEDFTLTENEKAQSISIFEFQRLTDPAEAPAPETAPPPTPAAPRAAPAVIAPSKPGEIRYRDRRLLALFFDFSSMPLPDQIRAQKAAEKFLDEQMSPVDLVSILAFSNRLQVLQDFTADRAQLKEIVRGFRLGEGSALAEEADTGDDTNPDTGAAFVADETEFNIFNTDRKLSALETAVRMLSSLPERKALVYFSSGVGKTGVENQSQLRSTVNAAVRANVAFYPIDSRGLMAAPPGGDASKAAPRGTGIFSGQAQTRQRERSNDQQETLTTLAADTGGKAFLDSNDLALGIVQAQTDIRSYYILGYYTTNDTPDGKFRRVRVKLTNPALAGAKLEFRSGYFGAKEFAKFSSADKERQLEEALLLGDPVTDLPLALEVDYFRLARDKYFIPVAVKIPASEIPLAHKGSAEVTEFDFIGQVRDSNNRLAATVRDGIKVKLSEAAAQRKSFQYDTGFTLPPGAYKLKFLVRENQTGKMGTFETPVAVPDLTVKGSTVALSSVVWSSQREPLAAAVGSAESKKKLIATHPLVRDGQKLVPNVTRVFRKDQNLYVYFEVYDPATDPERKAPSVSAVLSFYRGRAKASESSAVRITEAGRGHAVPFQFQVPLAQLRPGRYTCQVNVIDEIGRKFAFARAPIVVAP